MESSASQGIDAGEVKAGQRANWNEVSEGWAAVHDDFERGAATVTARLLELADVHPGQTILDVATGPGEPAVSAARVVGPAGHVIGIDIAAAMLETARRRAAGLSNIEFVEADLESFELPGACFDVVLSRFGLMFAIDHVAAFRAIARVLVPGGVGAAAVWGPQSSHLMSVGPAALSERLELPAADPGVPGPFSMSDPVLLGEELTAAGFVDVSVTEHLVPFRFAAIDDYVRFNKQALPPAMMRTARERLGHDDAKLEEIIAAAAAPYADDDGALSLPCTALLLRAVTPGPPARDGRPADSPTAT
jgi:SAM-dependent methyltransferase